jgi:hypothetical protein|eukprot:SAG11_NODE_271_length_11328_cov_3.757859_9_plen_83_part_00
MFLLVLVEENDMAFVNKHLLDGIAIDHFVMDEFHSSNTSWMALAIEEKEVGVDGIAIDQLRAMSTYRILPVKKLGRVGLFAL